LLLLLVGLLAGPMAALTLGAFGTRSLRLVAVENTPGYVSFQVHGRPGSTVVISELHAGKAPAPLETLHLRFAASGRRYGAPWSCTSRERSFQARETLPSGATETTQITTTTPPCQPTLTLWPSPPRVGVHLLATISAAAGGGGVLQACLRAPGGARQCQRLTLSGEEGSAAFVPNRVGTWQLQVSGPAVSLTRRVVVGTGALRLLATGDSEMQILDDDIADALAGQAQVTGQAYISTGLTVPGGTSWLTRAHAQAQGERPDVVVVFIGANDGFGIPDGHGLALCCGAPWVQAYAGRVEQMMGDYLRGGAGQVFWFTLPVPRPANFAEAFNAVDAADEIAASHFPAGVHLIDLRPVFTPGDQYHQEIAYGGQTVDVREVDGVHLSTGGDEIALQVLLGAMRQAGVL
jgi:lysophospholipase L1-like esterase